MLTRDQFDGSTTPFEGDRVLVLKSLPQGAQVTRAVVTLQPVAPPNLSLFEEVLSFPASDPGAQNPVQGNWGSTKLIATSFIEIDFHARRTLATVSGKSLGTGKLQVDLGGVYVNITDKGTIETPNYSTPYTLSTAPDGGDAGSVLPSLATTKFRLIDLIAASDISDVKIRSAPSNITVRLGQQPPFFARPGELVQQESCPDFSQILQIFLANAEVKDGFYQIPLTIHSDTICRLNVTVEVEYVQEQSPLPNGLQQATLTFDHSSTAKPGTVQLEVSIPAGARVIPRLTTARVRGSFQNSRIVYGPTGNIQPTSSILVNPSRAQATPLIYTSDLAASSVDLLLTATSPTVQLALDLVEDVDGKPWTRSILAEPAKLAIDSETAGKSTWVNVPLPSEVQFQKDRRYWLVLQSLQGEAAWAVGSQSSIATAASKGVWTAGAGVGTDTANGSSIGVYYTDTGGLSWRQETVPQVSGPLGAFFHLRKSTAVFEVPIAVEVGEGENVKRVSLDQFQPLGRVDFALDFDEMAQAINQVAGAAGAPAVPQGEHLRNGDMEKWKRVGDRINVPRPQPVEHTPVGLAVNSSGSRLYVLSNDVATMTTSFLEVYETACGEKVQTIELGLGTPVALALSPDETRAAIGLSTDLVWVALDTMQTIGGRQEFDSHPIPAFSPDGNQLYVLRYSSGKGFIKILERSAVEKAFREQSDLGTNSLLTIDVGSDLEPVDIIVSPDSARVYVEVINHSVPNAPGATSTVPESELYAFDSLSAQKTYGPIALGSIPPSFAPIHHMALSPDGRRLVVLRADGGVNLIDARRGRLEGSAIPMQIRASQNDTSIVKLTSNLRAVVISSDNRKAFVAHATTLTRDEGDPETFNLISVIDMPNHLILMDNEILVGTEPFDLAITPDGGKLYVAELNPQDFRVIRIGAQVPEEWTLTSGVIAPYCTKQTYHQIAVLGRDFDFERSKERRTLITEPTAISQVVSVVGQMHYALSFSGLASSIDALVEVFWYGDGCAFQQVDRLAFESAESHEAGSIENITLPTSLLEMTSPASASVAEVRFSVPANQIAVLDNASLQATADALSNGNLQGQSNGHLSGWEVTPVSVTGLTAIASSDSVTIRNAGTNVCSLRQRTPFQSEKKFNLFFDGQTLTGNPSLRVEWLGANNEDLGSPLDVSLAPNSSNREERRGASPAGTQQAVLSMIMPPGAGVSVRQISLNIVEVISVPVSFVAQAPGELVISDVRVVYEMTPSSTPGIPPNGLCPPTPLGGQPGSGSHTHCHCPNCGEDDELSNPEPTLTPAGAPALEGECSNCGARITLPGGSSQTVMAAKQKAAAPVTLAPLALQRTIEVMKPSVSKAAPTKTSPTPSPVTPTTPAPPTAESDASTLTAEMAAQPAEAAPVVNEANIVAPQVSLLAHMPASIVSGVGESFSKALKRLRPPITTIEELAALDPEVEIKSIPRQRRLEIKTAAEMILDVELSVKSFAALMDESLETLLTTTPADLANRAGQSIQAVEQFQRNLRALRLLVKNDDFRNLHLSDLMKAQG